MDPSILLQYWPILLNGFKLTILCWVLGTIFSMALGLIISLAQRYGPRPLGWLIQAYIEVIRGTPFLVQLFVLYYGGPLMGLRLDALPAGLLGLSVYGSPYFAEIFRAGYLAVPVGQLEAARAIGMSGTDHREPHPFAAQPGLGAAGTGQLLHHPDQGDGDPVDHHRAGAYVFGAAHVHRDLPLPGSQLHPRAVLLALGRNHLTRWPLAGNAHHQTSGRKDVR